MKAQIELEHTLQLDPNHSSAKKTLGLIFNVQMNAIFTYNKTINDFLILALDINS